MMCRKAGSESLAVNPDGAQDHALHLAEKLSRFARNVIVLTSGAGTKQRRAAMQRLDDVCAKDERVLIAAGRCGATHLGNPASSAAMWQTRLNWRVLI
jgi:hypothetical protein